MKKTLLTAGTALCLSALVQASDVNLSILSGGASQVSAVAGSSITYEVWAELSDNNNEGLALLCFDLEFDGGGLAQANAAGGATQLNFSSPLGLNNPAGYGGTPFAGKLLQVGGAQNTIKNTFAPIPNGTVMTGVAATGSPVLFASGSLTMPATAGTFHLNASQLIANVVRQGETGTGEFWTVDKAGAGALSGLTINVFDCAPVVYCSGKLNSQGCTPSIGFSGSSTLSGADDFHITASNVVENRTGLMFYGPAANQLPFFGGTLCVAPRHQRTATQFSGSTGASCSGSYDFLFSQSRMANAGLTVGSKFFAQYWYRDPAHQDGTGIGLSNALEVTICP